MSAHFALAGQQCSPQTFGCSLGHVVIADVPAGDGSCGDDDGDGDVDGDGAAAHAAIVMTSDKKMDPAARIRQA